MLPAIVRVVADKGYSGTTVADIIALAGVSRRTFYEHFASVEACFLAAYDDGLQALLAAVNDALAGVPKDDWQARSRAAVDAYLRALSAAPAGAAWAYTVEVLGAGRKALARRAAVLAQWVAQWRALQQARSAADPAVRPVDDATLLALVGGIEELVRECLRTRNARQLPSLLDAATGLALRVLDGGAG
jgi:AcrR family transcriptional regulator